MNVGRALGKWAGGRLTWMGSEGLCGQVKLSGGGDGAEQAAQQLGW